MAKKSITLHLDRLTALDAMDDKQVSKLFRAIKAYHCGEDVKPFIKDPVVNIIFIQLKNDFIRDSEKYDSIVESRRLCGRLGGLAKRSKSKQMVANATKSKQKQANGSKCKQMVANAKIANNTDENQSVTEQKNKKNEDCENIYNTSNNNRVVDNNINNTTEKKRDKKRKDTPNVISFPDPPKVKKAKVDDFEPPTLKEVEACFMQSAAQLPTWQDEAKIFFYHYDGLGWRNTHGVKIRNWDSFANKWIFDKINENKRRTNRQSDKRTTTAVDPDCGLIEPPSSM